MQKYIEEYIKDINNRVHFGAIDWKHNSARHYCFVEIVNKNREATKFFVSKEEYDDYKKLSDEMAIVFKAEKERIKQNRLNKIANKAEKIDKIEDDLRDFENEDEEDSDALSNLPEKIEEDSKIILDISEDSDNIV